MTGQRKENPCAWDCPNHSPSAIPPWKVVFPSKLRTEYAATHAGSHLVEQRLNQITQIHEVFGMVLAKPCLRDLQCTTTERLGILILALWRRRPRNAATETPWSTGSYRTQLTFCCLRRINTLLESVGRDLSWGKHKKRSERSLALKNIQ